MGAVATVSSERAETIDDHWGSIRSRISLLAPFDETSIAGLGDFSHLEVIYVFDRVDPEQNHNGARHPRGNVSWPEVGIFAQRAKDRPNRIGLCTVRLLEIDGTALVVEGLDAVDGSPVLDIKPFMAEFAPRGALHQPSWSHELMAHYF